MSTVDSDMVTLLSPKINLIYIPKADFTIRNPKGILSVQAVQSRSNMVQWTNPDELDKDSSYILQKSGSPEGDWFTLCRKTAADPSQYLDDDANNTFHRHAVEYYRLVYPAEKIIIGPATPYGSGDPIALEMARRHSILLKKGKWGTKGYLFIRRRAGTRCPDCWDEILQKRSRMHCTTCVDTGYLRGYYSPIPVWMNMPEEQTVMQHQLDGPQNAAGTIQCWTANYPIISSGDVWVENNSDRLWYVSSVGVTLHGRTATRQNVALNCSTGDDEIWDLLPRLPEGG